MKLNFFKDKMFELVNDADNINIKNIEVRDKENKMFIQLQDNSVFEIEIRQLKEAEKKQKKKAVEGNVRVYWMMDSDVNK